MYGITEIMVIRKAKVSDIQEIVEVFSDAKQSMKAAGINQWNEEYPGAAEAKRDIENGTAYVICDERQVIGYTCIQFKEDINYARIDGNWMNEAPYGVIHRTAILSSCKGKGLAGMFFDYAEKLAKEKGIHNLRIDTHKDNTPMQHCIAKHGYTYCGVVYMVNGDGSPRDAFQKIL